MTSGDLTISGPTRVAAVIGDPVSHSLSPAIHNAAFRAAGLDWVYVALAVEADRGADAVAAVRTLGLAGASVTMPHKAIVAATADERSAAVEALGAANCLVPVGDGRIRAENTDGAGFLAALHDDARFDITGRQVVILGAGGAARAVVLACAGAGAAAIVVVNRSPDRAQAAAALAGSAGRVGDETDLEAADLVVNATPLGMGADRSLPCDPELLASGQVAVDLVYDPPSTPWLAALRARGVEAHNGASMLVHQAALAFTHWTALPAPLDAMRDAMQHAIAAAKTAGENRA